MRGVRGVWPCGATLHGSRAARGSTHLTRAVCSTAACTVCAVESSYSKLQQYISLGVVPQSERGNSQLNTAHAHCTCTQHCEVRTPPRHGVLCPRASGAPPSACLGMSRYVSACTSSRGQSEGLDQLLDRVQSCACNRLESEVSRGHTPKDVPDTASARSKRADGAR